MLRRCGRCKLSLDATPENFARDASRPLGLAYECRRCHAARRKGRDRRKERWSKMAPEQKVKALARQSRYNRTQKGRALKLRMAYRHIDACDLTTEEVLALIVLPCVYCGTTDENRGLDRIDNSRPHVRGNVQTACTSCNLIRGDRFSIEEMMLLGAVVRQIRQARSVDHQRMASRLAS